MVAPAGPDFTFTPLREESLPFLIEVRNECRGFLHNDRAFSLTEAVAWFRAERPDFYLIRYRGETIGYFRLSRWRPAERSIYVGADLHRDFRGRGLAKAAYQVFLPWLKAERQIEVAELEVLSHNTIAIRLYQTLGFEETARKKGVTSRDGRSIDSIVMARRL